MPSDKTPSDMAQRFMDALQEIEKSGEVDALVKLFAEDAPLRRMTQDDSYRGKEEAAAFWREYLSVFGEIRTTFHHTTETDGCAVLEWSSEGSFTTGKRLRYDGVSIVEHDGNKVTGFRTYYDSATFAQEGAKG